MKGIGVSGGAGYSLTDEATQQPTRNLTRSEIAAILNDFYDKKPLDTIEIPAKLQKMHSLWFDDYNNIPDVKLEGVTGGARYAAISERRKDIKEMLAITIEYLKDLGIKETDKGILESFRGGSLLSEHLNTHAEEEKVVLFMREFVAYLISLEPVSKVKKLSSLEGFPCGMTEQEFECLEGSRERMAFVATGLEIGHTSYLEKLVIESHRSRIEEARTQLWQFAYEGNQPHVFSALEYFNDVSSKTTYAKSVALDIPSIAAWNLIARYVEDFNAEVDLRKKSLAEDIREILRKNPICDEKRNVVEGAPANVRDHLEAMGFRSAKRNEMVEKLYNEDYTAWDEDKIESLISSMQHPLAIEAREDLVIPEDLFSLKSVPQIVDLIMDLNPDLQKLGMRALLLTGRIVQTGSSFAQFLNIVTELGAILTAKRSDTTTFAEVARFDFLDELGATAAALGIEEDEETDKMAASLGIGEGSKKIENFYTGLKALRSIVEKSSDDLKESLNTILLSLELEKEKAIAYVSGNSNLSLLLKFNANSEDIKARMTALNEDKSEEGIKAKRLEVLVALDYMQIDDDAGCKIKSRDKFRNLIHNQGLPVIMFSIFRNDAEILNSEKFKQFAAMLIYFAAKYRVPGVISTILDFYPSEINDYIFNPYTSPFLKPVYPEYGGHYNILYHLTVVDNFTNEDGKYDKEKSLLMGEESGFLNLANTDILNLYDSDGYTLVQRLVVENKTAALKGILSCMNEEKRQDLIRQVSGNSKSLMELAIEVRDINYGIVAYLSSINPELLIRPCTSGAIPILYLAKKGNFTTLKRIIDDLNKINPSLAAEIIGISHNGATILDHALSAKKIDCDLVDYLISINPELASNLYDTLTKAGSDGAAKIVTLTRNGDLDALKRLLNKLEPEDGKSLINTELKDGRGKVKVIDMAYRTKNYKMMNYLASIAPQDVLRMKVVDASGANITISVVKELLNKGDLENLKLLLAEPLAEEQKKIICEDLLHWCANPNLLQVDTDEEPIDKDIADYAIKFLSNSVYFNTENILYILSFAHKYDNHAVIKSFISLIREGNVSIDLKEILNHCIAKKKWSLVSALGEVCNLGEIKINIGTGTWSILHCLANSDERESYEEEAIIVFHKEPKQYDVSAMIKNLIVKGVCRDIDCKNSKRVTPLRVAGYNHNNIRVLLESGAYQDIEAAYLALSENKPVAASNKALWEESIKQLENFNEFKQISKLVVESICESYSDIAIDPDTQFRMGRLIHRNLIKISEFNIDKLKTDLEISDISFGINPDASLKAEAKERDVFKSLVTIIADGFSETLESARKESEGATISIDENELLETNTRIYPALNSRLQGDRSRSDAGAGASISPSPIGYGKVASFDTLSR